MLRILKKMLNLNIPRKRKMMLWKVAAVVVVVVVVVETI